MANLTKASRSDSVAVVLCLMADCSITNVRIRTFSMISIKIVA